MPTQPESDEAVALLLRAARYLRKNSGGYSDYAPWSDVGDHIAHRLITHKLIFNAMGLEDYKGEPPKDYLA